MRYAGLLEESERECESALAYPAMEKDPLLASIRSRPEFAAIRALAIQRQKEIVEPWKAKQTGAKS